MSKGKYFFLRRHIDPIRAGDEFKGWNPDCTKLIWIPFTKKHHRDIIGTTRDEDFVSVRRRVDKRRRA